VWALRASRARGKAWLGIAGVSLYLAWQSVAARAHANDYTDDLVFWDATRKAVPHSAKAHLNYSVMQGARGNLEERRKANAVALELAPKWPMASIYLGDTLCRMHRAAEAWPYYKQGFELNPADPNLIALALQCLWDEKYYATVAGELSDMGEQHPGSWLDFLQRDLADHGEEHSGIDPKYRPRGYNEGPKNEN
jgi:tetratricopeptide (TPR) repeat protein